jgi:hypothetical protein
LFVESNAIPQGVDPTDIVVIISPSAAYTSEDIIGIAEDNINAIRNKGRIFLERFNNSF